MASIADLDREESLRVLACLDVELPAETKLPLVQLHRRVAKAIDCTQAPLKSKKEFDPSELKTWPANLKPLAEAAKTLNVMEAAKNYANEKNGIREPSTLYCDPFMDLRQTVMSIGAHWDKGVRHAVIEDAEGTHGLTIRFLEVYELEEEIPIFLVLYEQGRGPATKRRLASTFMESLKAGTPCIRITATPLEQKLLLKLLQQNSKRVAASYEPQRTQAEAKYKLSAFVPPSPLSFHDIGNLRSNTGCVVCGDPTKSRCARCQSQNYCSKECQTEDWTTHKLMCKSLAGGVWIPVTFSLFSDMSPYSLALNKRTTMTELASKQRGDDSSSKDSPPNIHGERAFITKLQASLGGGANPIMMYDRQRSFQAIVKRDVDPRAYDAIVSLVRSEGIMGAKIYRYTKRTGDRAFSICLDREPKDDIKW